MHFKKRKIYKLIEYAIKPDGFELLREDSFQYNGPVALLGGQPTIEQTDWAVYDDGTEAGSQIIGSVNNNVTLEVDTIYLFRGGIEETANNLANNVSFATVYNHNGGGFNDVDDVSSVVQIVDSTNITDGDDTTQRLGGAFTFITANGGYDDVDGVTDGITLQNNGFEALWAIQIIGADVSPSDTIVIKIIDDKGGDLDVYNQTDLTITVASAAGAEIDRTIAEPSIDVTDNPLRSVAATREFLEAMGVDDVILRGMLINRDLIDSIDINDFVETWALRNRILSENITANDALFVYAAFSRVIAEGLDINDFLVTTVAGGLFSIVISESFDVNDFALISVERQRLLQDSTDVDDKLLSTVERLRVVFENVEVVDAILAARKMLKVLLDTTAISDTLRADVLGLMYTITLTDSVDADDTLSRVAKLSRLIADSLNANDNILVNISGQLISRIIAEGISVSDLISAGFFHSRILQDIVVAADAISKVTNFGRTVTDSVDIDPFVLRTLIATRLFQENIETTDQLVLAIARLLEVTIKALIDIKTSDIVLGIDTLPVELGIDEDIPSFGTNVLVTGDLVRATLTKAFLDANASDVSDTYNNNYCYIPSGVAAGRKPRITDYTVSLVKNELLYSRDPSNIAWTDAGVIELTQNAEGYYGEANTAWLINDASTTALSQIWQTFTIPDDTNTNCIGVAILKDTNENRFPGIQVDFFGGSSVISSQRFMFNTKTGDSVLVNGVSTAVVIDAGDWWIFCVAVTNNGTGNTTGLITFLPASGHVWGLYSSFTIGSCVVDLFQARLNASELGELIPTTDTTVEETVRVCSVDFDIIPNDTPVYQVLSNVGARS